MPNTLRLYHANGTPCADRSSCGDTEHTSVPPLCAAEPAAGTAGGTTRAAAGGPVACDLPSGHPGPHLHAATGREYQDGRG